MTDAMDTVILQCLYTYMNISREFICLLLVLLLLQADGTAKRAPQNEHGLLLAASGNRVNRRASGRAKILLMRGASTACPQARQPEQN